MKRIGWIGLLVLLALAACTSRSKQVPEPVEGPSPELSAIDSLMWRQPDSALARLNPYFDTCTTTEYNCHYAHLLLAELLYKNDYAQTNRPALLQAVAYFDSLTLTLSDTPLPKRLIADTDPLSLTRNDNLAFLDARAHYINGVGYYENDSVVDACKEYLKALEVMESRFEEKDLVGNKAQFIAMTYIRLTVLFSDLYLHEQTIYFAQYSLFYYRKQKPSSWHLSWIMNEIATHYDIMEELDSANYYYQEASAVLNDTNIILFRDIAAHQAFLQYRQDNNQTEATLLQLQHLLSRSENKEECDARSLVIGEIFYCEKQFDSAWHYLDKVYRQTSNVGAKKQAAERLVNICKTVDKNISIVEYANFLIPFANQEENTSTTKSQLTELYNTFRQNILKQQHRQVMQKSMTRMIVVIGGLFIIIMIVVLLYHQNKKKLRQFESVEPDESEIQSKAWDKYAAFMEEPICQDIIQSVQGENIKRLATPKDYPNLVLSDEQLQQLAFTVNRYYGPIEYHLEQHGVKASPIMVSLCHLLLLGMDEKQAAILLDRDYSSITRYVKKLKTAFETQESLTVYFRNLVLSN